MRLTKKRMFEVLEARCEGIPEITQELGLAREEEAFDQLAEQDTQCVPNMTVIPRFFRCTSQSPDARDDDNSGLARAIGQRLRREARAKMQRRRTLELMEEDALHSLLDLLKKSGCKRLSDWVGSEEEYVRYHGFKQVLLQLVEQAPSPQRRSEVMCKFESFLSHDCFKKFYRTQGGSVAIAPFFSYVVRKVNIKQTRIQLSYYDTTGHGYLREKDMENFIFELIPTLSKLRDLQEEFYPFYVFTAVRKFFFFLDPNRTCRIFISDLLDSAILPELYELRQDQELDDSANNWFGVQSALKIYSTYLELDVDQNGMLSPAELARYGSPLCMLTEEFVQRVFEEYQTYRDADGGQEMDYKTYLNFVLAMENKPSEQSIRYFFRLLDINRTGKLDSNVISYFFTFVSKSLEERNQDTGVKVEDVKDEIFDMVRPKNPEYITLEDLISSKVGGTVISMLIDMQAFWHYDNREYLMNDIEQFEET